MIDETPELDVRGKVRRYWWTALAVPLLGFMGYLFYLSLGLPLPGVLVAAGSLFFFLIGMAAFIVLPFIISKDAPEAIRHRIFRLYHWLSQRALERGGIVKREHAGVDLCASSFDAEKGGERVKLDGEPRDFEDIADRMRYLKGPFFIALERSTLFIDPVDAAIGKRRQQALEAGEEVIDFGQQLGEAVLEHVSLPAEAPVVDLADAWHLIGGSGKPDQGEATEEFETKAWAEHQQIPVADAMVLAGIFIGVGVAVWVGFSFAESTGSDGGSGGGGMSDIVSGFLVPMVTMEVRYRL